MECELKGEYRIGCGRKMILTREESGHQVFLLFFFKLNYSI